MDWLFISIIYDVNKNIFYMNIIYFDIFGSTFTSQMQRKNTFVDNLNILKQPM